MKKYGKVMKVSKKKIVMIFLLPFFLWVLTWGICIYSGCDSDCEYPSGNSNEEFFEGETSFLVYAYLDGGVDQYDIPYLFYVTKDKLPYHLNLVFSSYEAKKADEIIITYLSIKHNNKGAYSLIQSEDPKKCYFDFYDDRGQTVGYKPHYTASLSLPGTIKYRSSFEIDIKGDICIGEKPQHFEQKFKLKYIRVRYVYPRWLEFLLGGLAKCSTFLINFG